MTRRSGGLPKAVRFVVVGAANTAIDFLLFFLLASLMGVPFVWANMVSTSVALAFSFFMNRTYTFGSSGNIGAQVARFLLFTLIGLWVIQPILIWLVIQIPWPLPSDLTLLGAKLVATGGSMVWNYLTYDRFVFPSQGREEEAND